MQIVGGDGPVLLLDETERREVEAGLLARSVFQHGGELIDGAPFKRAKLIDDTQTDNLRRRTFWDS